MAGPGSTIPRDVSLQERPDGRTSQRIADSATDGAEHVRWIAEVAEAVRRVEPRAFLVPPRILRRVIKTDRALTGLGFRVPHRKSYTLSGTRVKYFVDKDDLGLSVADDFPTHVFLLSEPKESEIAGMSQDDLRRWAWRLLFHARIHFELDKAVKAGDLSLPKIRSCVDRIGQVEFDEIESVLEREHFLFGRADRAEVLEEFTAVYWEYRFFAPERLPWYFPSVPDFTAVESILRENVDVDRLLQETKIEGVSQVTAESSAPEQGTDERRRNRSRRIPSTAVISGLLSGDRETRLQDVAPNRRKFRRRANVAARAAKRGNTVRAAVLYTRAAAFGTDDEQTEAANCCSDQLDKLAGRLQAALAFDDAEARDWRTVLGKLVVQSHRAFWNADRKLLSDLQKVCIDHERDVYSIDLMEWVRSLGQRPVKRRLPHQREVLIVKHLRSALGRLKSIRIPETDRQTLSRLLHAAVKDEERVLRERLRPVIGAALSEVGYTPENVCEHVAFDKIIEEILDQIVKRGYANMGSLRDAISRSWLKLEDVSGPKEFLAGDKLLKADRELSVELDGVYRRGEFYLRWMQRLSSVAFGTKIGRWLMLFLVMPFGCSYVVLSFFGHLLEKLPIEVPHFASWTNIAVGGVFMLAMIHWPTFRQAVVRLLTWTTRFVGAVLIDMPVWAIRNRAIRQLLRSPPVVFLRRYVLVPFVLTICFCFALPAMGLYPQPSLILTGAVYLLLTGIINSRMGRNVEELTADWVEHTWFRLRTRVFIALFEAVMSSFRRVMEVIERFLYAVDEWLRFRSGENRLTLLAKAIFGMMWGVVSFVLTFAVTLLIEPQINPIKHFPVVTVGHKIILPMGFPGGLLSQLIEPLAGSAEMADAIAGSIVWLIPGIFGFLVWELRSNWQLYRANQSERLHPVVVGSHGETMLRLLKPGFHSGTLPKLFGKIRRAVRTMEKTDGAADGDPSAADGNGREPQHAERGEGVNLPAKFSEALHHVNEAVQHFVERELISVLEATGSLEGMTLHVGDIRLSSNNLSVAIHADRLEDSPLVIVFQEQSGRLLTGILETGWLRELNAKQREHLAAALAGLYQQSGADLVREQIVSCLPLADLRYDIAERALVLWPDGDYETEIRYELDDRTRIVPRPRSAAERFDLPVLSSERLLFSQGSIAWSQWCGYWEAVLNNRGAAPPEQARYVLPQDDRSADASPDGVTTASEPEP